MGQLLAAVPSAFTSLFGGGSAAAGGTTAGATAAGTAATGTVAAGTAAATTAATTAAAATPSLGSTIASAATVGAVTALGGALLAPKPPKPGALPSAPRPNTSPRPLVGIGEGTKNDTILTGSRSLVAPTAGKKTLLGA